MSGAGAGAGAGASEILYRSGARAVVGSPYYAGGIGD